jgi:hypothetical protein
MLPLGSHCFTTWFPLGLVPTRLGSHLVPTLFPMNLCSHLVLTWFPLGSQRFITGPVMFPLGSHLVPNMFPIQSSHKFPYVTTLTPFGPLCSLLVPRDKERLLARLFGPILTRCWPAVVSMLARSCLDVGPLLAHCCPADVPLSRILDYCLPERDAYMRMRLKRISTRSWGLVFILSTIRFLLSSMNSFERHTT